MLGLYDFGTLDDKIEVNKEFLKPQWDGFDIEDKYDTALPEGF